MESRKDIVEYEWKSWSDFDKEGYWAAKRNPAEDGWEFEWGAWRRPVKPVNT